MQKCPIAGNTSWMYTYLFHSFESLTIQNVLHCRNDSYMGPLYWYGLILIPILISGHMPCKLWDEITYPFPKFYFTPDQHQWIGQRHLPDETRKIYSLGFGAAYARGFTVVWITKNEQQWKQSRSTLASDLATYRIMQILVLPTINNFITQIHYQNIGSSQFYFGNWTLFVIVLSSITSMNY